MRVLLRILSITTALLLHNVAKCEISMAIGAIVGSIITPLVSKTFGEVNQESLSMKRVIFEISENANQKQAFVVYIFIIYGNGEDDLDQRKLTEEIRSRSFMLIRENIERLEDEYLSRIQVIKYEFCAEKAHIVKKIKYKYKKYKPRVAFVVSEYSCGSSDGNDYNDNDSPFNDMSSRRSSNSYNDENSNAGIQKLLIPPDKAIVRLNMEETRIKIGRDPEETEAKDEEEKKEEKEEDDKEKEEVEDEKEDGDKEKEPEKKEPESESKEETEDNPSTENASSAEDTEEESD